MFLKEYVKAEPYVTVFGVEKSGITELTEEVQRLTETVGKQEGRIAEAKDKSLELYAKLEGLRTQNEELAQQFKDMNEPMKMYESFTKSFMDATAEELEELGKAILKKRLREEAERS